MSSAESCAAIAIHHRVLARARFKRPQLRFEVRHALAGKVRDVVGDADAVDAVAGAAHRLDARLAGGGVCLGRRGLRSRRHGEQGRAGGGKDQLGRVHGSKLLGVGQAGWAGVGTCRVADTSGLVHVLLRIRPNSSTLRGTTTLSNERIQTRPLSRVTKSDSVREPKQLVSGEFRIRRHPESLTDRNSVVATTNGCETGVYGTDLWNLDSVAGLISAPSFGIRRGLTNSVVSRSTKRSIDVRFGARCRERV